MNNTQRRKVNEEIYNHEFLSEKFEGDFLKGLLYRIRNYAGKPMRKLVESKGSNYLQVHIAPGITMSAHRILYNLYHGEYPKDQIDHWNTCKLDNSISNLVPTSQTENMRNLPVSAKNITGFSGIHLSPNGKSFKVQIGIGRGKRIYLGTFSTLEEACEVRWTAAKLHGYRNG